MCKRTVGQRDLQRLKVVLDRIDNVGQQGTALALQAAGSTLATAAAGEADRAIVAGATAAVALKAKHDECITDFEREILNFTGERRRCGESVDAFFDRVNAMLGDLTALQAAWERNGIAWRG